MTNVGQWLTERRDGKNTRLANIVIGTVSACILAIAAHNYTLSTQIHDSLCTFRGDLVTRVEQGKQYVKDNPQILKEFGINRKQYESQLAQQQQTIDSLDDLDCGG